MEFLLEGAGGEVESMSWLQEMQPGAGFCLPGLGRKDLGRGSATAVRI